MINLKIFRVLFFIISYYKWKFLGLEVNKFIQIYPNVLIQNLRKITIKENVTLYSGSIIKSVKGQF